MSKLVDRLRREVGPGDWIYDVRNDAADRIEQLEAALRDILKFKVEWEIVGIMQIAHQALEGRKWDES